MSKSRDKQPDFAYTQFLVRGMEKIREDILARDFRMALEDIYWGLMPFLDVDIQKALEHEEELIEKINEDATGVSDPDPFMQVRNASRMEIAGCRRQLRPILQKTMRLIHEAGYFWDARKGLFFDPSGGRKSGKEQREGFGQRVEAKI